MPDAEGNTKADSGTDTSLHAYKEGGGGGDVKGDPTGDDVEAKPVEERQDSDKH